MPGSGLGVEAFSRTPLQDQWTSYRVERKFQAARDRRDRCLLGSTFTEWFIHCANEKAKSNRRCGEIATGKGPTHKPVDSSVQVEWFNRIASSHFANASRRKMASSFRTWCGLTFRRLHSKDRIRKSRDGAGCGQADLHVDDAIRDLGELAEIVEDNPKKAGVIHEAYKNIVADDLGALAPKTPSPGGGSGPRAHWDPEVREVSLGSALGYDALERLVAHVSAALRGAERRIAVLEEEKASLEDQQQASFSQHRDALAASEDRARGQAERIAALEACLADAAEEKRRLCAASGLLERTHAGLADDLRDLSSLVEETSVHADALAARAGCCGAAGEDVVVRFAAMQAWHAEVLAEAESRLAHQCGTIARLEADKRGTVARLKHMRGTIARLEADKRGAAGVAEKAKAALEGAVKSFKAKEKDLRRELGAQRESFRVESEAVRAAHEATLAGLRDDLAAEVDRKHRAIDDLAREHACHADGLVRDLDAQFKALEACRAELERTRAKVEEQSILLDEVTRERDALRHEDNGKKLEGHREETALGSKGLVLCEQGSGAKGCENAACKPGVVRKRGAKSSRKKPLQAVDGNAPVVAQEAAGKEHPATDKGSTRRLATLADAKREIVKLQDLVETLLAAKDEAESKAKSLDALYQGHVKENSNYAHLSLLLFVVLVCQHVNWFFHLLDE